MTPIIQLSWPSLEKWYLLPLYSLCVVAFCQGMIHLNPYNLDWINDGSFSWGNLLQFLLIDQTLIECISVGVILIGIRRYSSWMEVEKVRFNIQGVSIYFLKYIPLFLLIYFCFAPLTTTLRYFYHSFLYADAGDYFQQYFFLSSKIYLMYLFPIFLTGYAFLVLGIMLGKRIEAKEAAQENQVLRIRTNEGEIMLSTTEIVGIERRDRKTWITTRKKERYTGNWTLASLEEMLPKQEFLRINRANILRVSYIKSWSHWKDHSYILRSIEGDEFVVSRARMKQVKEVLNTRMKKQGTGSINEKSPEKISRN